MELLWSDAFDIPDIDAIRARYESSSAPASLTGGRTNQCLGLASGELEKRFNQGYQTVVIGIACIIQYGAGIEFLRIYESGGTRQLTLHFDTAGTISLYRGSFATGTLLATTSPITAGFWTWIELLVTIHPTAGSYELRVNEVTQFSASNVNTRNGAYNDVQRVSVNSRADNGGNGALFIDDYVIYNAATPFPGSSNYFPGNCKVESMVPSGNGDVIGWTKFNDSNYKNVDERPHNSDTDYNYSSTVNASDLFQMGNMSAGSGSIRGVQLTYVARKDDALTRATRPLLKTGGQVYPGSNDSLTTSYAHYYETWTQNPQTVSDWDIATINLIQCGVQTTS